MKNVWFISDTHFGHANILTFKMEDGTMLREFSCVEEMDEHMVERWNAVVAPNDRVYHLGDVAINKKHISTVSRLNGKKVLILGNHDIYGAKEYLKYFEDVRAYKVYPQHGIVCSHIPVHTDNMYRWKLNVHGHTHGNFIQEKYIDLFSRGSCEKTKIDPRYLNICVEQINYTPINLDDILKLDILENPHTPS